MAKFKLLILLFLAIRLNLAGGQNLTEPEFDWALKKNKEIRKFLIRNQTQFAAIGFTKRLEIALHGSKRYSYDSNQITYVPSLVFSKLVGIHSGNLSKITVADSLFYSNIRRAENKSFMEYQVLDLATNYHLIMFKGPQSETANLVVFAIIKYDKTQGIKVVNLIPCNRFEHGPKYTE